VGSLLPLLGWSQKLLNTAKRRMLSLMAEKTAQHTIVTPIVATKFRVDMKISSLQEILQVF